MWEFLPTSGNQNCIYYTNQHPRKSHSFTAAFKHIQNIPATAICKVTLPTEVSICSMHYLVSSACCHQCYDTMHSGIWVTFLGEHNTLIPKNDSSMSFPRTHHATWHHVPEECHVAHRMKICHNLPIHSFTENKTKQTKKNWQALIDQYLKMSSFYENVRRSKCLWIQHFDRRCVCNTTV